MKKIESRAKKLCCGMVVLFAAFVMLAPVVMADEGTTGGGGEGVLTRVINKIKNPFSGSGLGDLFGEESAADVGHKPRIRPHFAFNQGFNSNARLGEEQADAAWQARMAPGITVSIPSGKLYTEVDYTYAFTTTQGRKTNENINTHNLNALARYDLSVDTTVGVGNNFQISDVPGTKGDTFTLNTTSAQVRHRLSPKLVATAGDTVQWFNDNGTARENDFVDNGVSIGLSYDATADLNVGPTFAWNIRDFDKIDGKDYWQIQPGIAAGYRLGPKTTLGGNFGWAFRRFDEGRNNTESELVWGATASHKLGRKFVWSFSYAKTLQDTFDTSFVFRDLPSAVALDNLDRDFRVLKSHRLGSAATYNFNEKNSVGAFGDFQFLTADSKDRIAGAGADDERAMEIGARYIYRFNRYISFDAAYAFGRRFSGPGNPAQGRASDYTFHKVTGGVNIAV